MQNAWRGFHSAVVKNITVTRRRSARRRKRIIQQKVLCFNKKLEKSLEQQEHGCDVIPLLGILLHVASICNLVFSRRHRRGDIRDPGMPGRPGAILLQTERDVSDPGVEGSEIGGRSWNHVQRWPQCAERNQRKPKRVLHMIKAFPFRRRHQTIGLIQDCGGQKCLTKPWLRR